MHVLHCTLPTHPRTGLRAVGIVNGRPVWPILGGSGEGGDGGQGGSSGDGGGSGGSGGDGGQGGGDSRPFRAPASQEEFDRIINQAVGRAHAKYGMTPDEAKAYKERAEKLDYDLSSATERAVADARKEEREKARSEATPRIVRAEFRAAAKGVLSEEQLGALLEDLDLSRYVKDNGDADVEKIAAKIAKFAPNGGAGGGNGHNGGGNGSNGGLNLGQGPRRPSGMQPGEAGRAMAEKRFGGKARSAQS